jgi:hypothetical protein
MTGNEVNVKVKLYLCLIIHHAINELVCQWVVRARIKRKIPISGTVLRGHAKQMANLKLQTDDLRVLGTDVSLFGGWGVGTRQGKGELCILRNKNVFRDKLSKTK